MFCAAAFSAHAQTTFRYKSTAGEKLKYRMMIADSTSAMGQDGATSFNAVLDLNTEKVYNDSMTVTAVIETLTAKVNNPMMGMGDTTITPTALFGKRTRQTLTPTGKVLSSNVVDTPDVSDPVVRYFAQHSSDLMQPWIELGATPVKKGDTWRILDIDSNDAGGKGMIYDTTTVVCSYQRNSDTLHHSCAVITYTVKIIMAGNLTSQSGQIELDGDGTGSGTAYWDADKGRLIANNGKTNVTQNLTLTSMQQTITQTLSKTQNTTIIE